MKRLFCLTFAVIALLSASSPAAEPLTAPQRAELLGRLQAIHAKSPCFQAAFSEQRTSKLLKKPLVSTGHIFFQVPNKFRRDVTGSNPSLTVCNGQEIWLYYPNFNEAEHCNVSKRAVFAEVLDALTAGLNFTGVEEAYQMEATPDEGGGYRIDLTPKKTNLKRLIAHLTVILDKDLDISRTNLVLPKGDQVVTTYTATRRESIPASTFEFVPPAGASISRPLGK